jgi:hypothetical protein
VQARRAAWVDLPTPSPPSIAISRPGVCTVRRLERHVGQHGCACRRLTILDLVTSSVIAFRNRDNPTQCPFSSP